MYLNSTQLILIKVSWLIFILAQNCINHTSGFRCGYYGFNCINRRHFQRCNIIKKNIGSEPISTCPRDTICNERYKSACEPISQPSVEEIERKALEKEEKDKELKENIEIGNIIDTEMTKSSHKRPMYAKLHYNELDEDWKSIRLPHNKIVSEIADQVMKCNRKQPGHNWNKKYGRSKKCVRDVKHLKEKKRSKFRTRYLNKRTKSSYANKHHKYSTKGKSSQVKNKGSNKNRKQKSSSAKISKVNNANEKFNCPSIGSFPIKREKKCFYICYRTRRSSLEKLKAIMVCCPDDMYFDKKTHKCRERILKKKIRRKRDTIWKYFK